MPKTLGDMTLTELHTRLHELRGTLDAVGKQVDATADMITVKEHDAQMAKEKARGESDDDPDH